MLCKAIIKEYGHSRSCWLPAETTSYFGFCRRCHFEKVSTTLDAMRLAYQHGLSHTDAPLLEEDFFLTESLHRGREQAFISLLSALRQHSPQLLSRVLEKIKDKHPFQILVRKGCLYHTPGSRCLLFRTILKECKYTPPNITLSITSGLCWNCVAWIISQRIWAITLWKFTLGLATAFETVGPDTFYVFGLVPFLSIITSLHIFDRESLGSMLFKKLQTHFHDNEQRDLLIRFFCQTPLLPVALTKNIKQYIPEELDTDDFKLCLYTQAKKTIKDHTSSYEEELISRAWHPDRVLQWCMNPTGFQQTAKTFASK